MAWPTHTSNENLHTTESAYRWPDADLESSTPDIFKRSQASYIASLSQPSIIIDTSSMSPSCDCACAVQLPSTPVSFGTVTSLISTYSDSRTRTASIKLNSPELPSDQRNEATIFPASSYFPEQFSLRADPAEMPLAKSEVGRLCGPYDFCTAKGSSSSCSRQKSKENDVRYGTYKCEWNGCQYDRLFSRKAVLMRHIEMQHVNPRSFKCPWCSHASSRWENMKAHRQAIHKERL